MNLGLTFSPAVPVPGGFLREAIATPRFWQIYRSQSFKLMMKHGVSIAKNDAGRFVVRFFIAAREEAPRPSTAVYALRDPVGLREYQAAHAGHLAAVIGRYGAAADLSDTGTGKTYIAAAVARELGLKPIVVCPQAIMRKYSDVLVKMRVPFHFVVGWEEAKGKKFAPVEKIYKEVLTLGPGGERATKKELTRMRWNTPKDAILIFDEAHRAKGLITQNARLLSGSAGIPTLMCSATLASSPKDMWAAGYRLGLHSIGNFKEWCESLYCFRDDKTGYTVVDDETSAKMLRDLIIPEHGSRIAVRDLGDKFPQNNVTCELINVSDPNKVNSLYEEAAARVHALKEAGHQAEALVARLRFRQAAELEKIPGLIEMAEDYAAEGNSVVLFVCFRDSLKLLAEKLGENRCALIYGGQDKRERAKNEESFQRNNSPFCLTMIQAGGVGIDLHDLYGKPRVSLISPCDSERLLKQALGRIHRDGALSPARQIIAFAAGTVEEQVCKNVAQKILFLDTLNDGDLMEPSFRFEEPVITEAA